MRKVLKVSRSCYYRRHTAKPGKRYLENQQSARLTKQESEAGKKRYGSLRIARSLRSKGHVISPSRVAKLMRSNGWRSIVKK